MNEPILTENKKRFVLFPIKYNDIWQMYKKAESCFWTTEEIDLSKDMNDWEKLSGDEQLFIKHILAFFAGSDGIVNENLGLRFMNEVQIPEARAFYSLQNMMETIHSETYSVLIDTYVKDSDEKENLFNAIETIPCVARKADWALKWIYNEGKDDFATRLVAFACVEGIFFSGAFCAIYWLKERGLMPGLCMSNEFISRDEGLHTDFAIMLHSHLNKKCSHIESIVKECVDIEKEFINDSIPCSMLGMNKELMSEYIEYVADRLLVQFGKERVYNTRNPFDFMERISMSNKTNFFEARVSEYSRANISLKKTDDHHDFSIDEDF